MQVEQAASSRPSSSERSSSSAHHMDKEGMESDEDTRRVPELGLELPGGASTSGREAGPGAGGPDRAQSSTAQATSRRRVRSPADKEHKRLKRTVELHILSNTLQTVEAMRIASSEGWCRRRGPWVGATARASTASI
ncbi:unnamed protein product [Urochloa humidicola]